MSHLPFSLMNITIKPSLLFSNFGCCVSKGPLFRLFRTHNSHLPMVHGLNANERATYLKRAILCPPTIESRLPNTTTVKAKLKAIGRQQDRRVAECSRKSLGREQIVDIRRKPYTSFRLCHLFSLMVVGPSMSGKK